MNLIKKVYVLGAVLLLAAGMCRAQSYYFKRYQAEDGLAHNSVITMMQDSKGLMWIGTRGGLNRFDGYTFKSFKNPDNAFGTLGDNIILSIAEDHNGMIWVGTGRGLFRYNPYKEQFAEISKPYNLGISDIKIDKDNNLWFISRTRLHKFDQSHKKLYNTNIKATCFGFDRQQNLWVANGAGLVRQFDKSCHQLKRIQMVNAHGLVNGRNIGALFVTGGDELLVGTAKHGLKSYNIKTGAIESLLERNIDNTEIYVRDILPNGDDEYWIATESGVYIYNLRTHVSKNLRKRAGDNYSLGDNSAYSICKDKQGGLWVGTYFGGLNYYSSTNARFEKYFPLQGFNSLSGSAVREISGDSKGNIWIGTEDAGVNKFDPHSGKFTSYTSDGKPSSISYPNIHGMRAIGDQLFLGPFQHGLEIMDTRTGRVTDRFKRIGEKNTAVNDFVMSVYQTRDSTILVGTTGAGAGLFKFNKSTKSFTKVNQMPLSSFVYAILEDHEGTIWTGSFERGAFYYNPKTGLQGNLRFNDSTVAKFTFEYMIQGIHEDEKHNLWFATEGGGLVKLGSDRKTIAKFTTRDGLPSNYLYRILEDDQQQLWISSLKGLICFDLKTEKSKVYTRSNGLITDQFNYNSAYKDKSGKMYFGSVRGMVAFDPAQFGRQVAPPPTYFTGFQIENKEVIPGGKNSPLKKSILYTDTIVLKYDQANFSIEFAALGYSSPTVTRYRYFMRGLDKHWTYLNTNRKAYFTDLSAGDYTFVLKAESNVGDWTGKERHLFIKILPPFWETKAAYFIYSLLSGLLVYLLVRLYNQYLDKQNQEKLRRFEQEKQKEVYEAKIEFFTNIAHEIQTPLTLIIGPVEQVMKKVDEVPAVKKSLQMIDKHANRLLKLTTQLLDFRKTEMDQFGLNFVKVNIASLLKEQVALFFPEAQKAGICLTVQAPKNQVIAYVDREAFNKICTNLISNAIKYGESKATVTVAECNPGDANFSVIFSNDGRAIPEEYRDQIFEPFFRLRSKEKQGTGIGLSLAKSLTELHNGTLVLRAAEEHVIEFELTLPVHQKFEFKLGGWKSKAVV